MHELYCFNSKRRQVISALATIAANGLVASAGRAEGTSATDIGTVNTIQSPVTNDPALPLILSAFADAAKKQTRLKAAVVSLQGQTVFAEAFRGPPVDQAVNIKSVSKSVVATLLGVARNRSIIDSLEQTLGELTPGLIPPQADARTSALTLEDLVTMRAGLQRTSGAAYAVWVNSDNWIRHVLTRPYTDQPGGRMLYSTGSTHVLGAVLTELTGRSLLELANDWLGEPLDITFAPWTRDPQGFYLGGNEMSLSPLDLSRLGELYLGNGVFNGQTVLDSDWAEDAFTPRTRSVYSGDGYGYGWFLRTLAGIPAAYARGYGGQVLHVVPALSLTVTLTSDETRPARSAGYMSVLHDLVAERIVSPLLV